MNFHISPLSPLRPRYSTSLSPSSAARPSGPSEQIRQREPDDDHDDDDENDDQHRGTDQHHHQQNHHRHRFLVLPHHAPPPRTPAARRSPLAGRPKIEVDAAGDHDVNTTSNSSGSSGSSGSDSDSSSVISADDDDDDVTQDSRDVLVQRLNDLAGRLGAADKVRGGDVGALHAHVDAMERVLSAGTGGSRRHRRRGAATARSTTTAMTTATGGNSSLSAAAGRRGSSLQRNGRSSMVFPGGGGGGGGSGGHSGDALGLMGPPLSPSWLLSQLQRRQPSISSLREVKEKEKDEEGGGDDVDERGRTNGARPVVPPPASLHPPSSAEHPEPVVAAAATTPRSPSSSRLSYEMADTIVQEAEGLCAEMASVIESLQKRREESDHLQAVLVEREVAADKLLREQAGRIGELEGAAAEDESELRYLRIQLRAIEAQCLGYVPAGADPELDRSIRSWKDDWSELRGRWAARKGSSFAAAAAVTGSSSESGGSTLSGPARLGSPVAL